MDERSEQAIPLEVFISSAIEDEEQRQALEKHLSVLKHQKLITSWHRSNGMAGTLVEAEIYHHLNSAHIILLLISPDFFASDVCYNIELKHALQQHAAGNARVIPIILRPISWEGAPFQGLPVLPRDTMPIQSTQWPSVDEAWKHVVEHLRKVVGQIRAEAVKQFTVCFSSPGDTREERQLVRQVVEKLQQDMSAEPPLRLKLIIRDDQDIENAILASPASPTHTIKPSQCDIVIVLFWAHMGTPLPAEIVKRDDTSYASTNEWDYEEAVNGAKRQYGRPAVLVYRNWMLPPQSDEINHREAWNQLLKVNGFFAQFTMTDSARDGYRSYQTLEQFADYLEQDLRTTLANLLTQTPPVDSARAAQEMFVPAPVGDSDELLKSYLHWMIKQHSDLELRGLGGDARLPTIPLEQVYVALKGIRASAYEREQSQQLLLAETFDILADLHEDISQPELIQRIAYSRNQAIIANPLLPSSVEQSRPGYVTAAPDESEEAITLGDAFRQKRWMVILGDPGSGKTTLARWIALKLASALLQGEPAVIVSRHQVDPKIDKTDTTTIDIGPTRLPVLLKVSEFAVAYAKKRDKRETYSLLEFLGHHSWLNQSPDLAPSELNSLIRQYLEEGRAVIILDGMDEITDARLREDVIRAIEAFIDKWINARGQEVSFQGKHLLWDRLKRGEPAKTAENQNQIIITSREVGYGFRPIHGQVAHVKIQPMDPLAVEHFCEAWTLAIHRLLYPHEQSTILQRRASLEADHLKEAIFDPRRPRVRELASNPLLVTILALVYRNNRGSLPEQRSELYQEAMKILISTWRFTEITSEEVEYILSPLAAYIHQYCPKDAIEESDLRAVIKKTLVQFPSQNGAPAFGLKVDDFIRCVREDVGLLAERGKEIYSFLHLTFQEYLTALYLVRDQQSASQAIIEKLEDPRWHEPILMALGHISQHRDWGSEDREQLLTDLLSADDPLEGLIPRSALLIVTAIPEMVRVPEKIVHEIIRRLLNTYANRDGIGQFASLRERINKALKLLYKSKYQPLLVQYLEKAILTIEKGERNLALAAASLLVEHGWSSESLLKALLKAFPYDAAEWDYPITRFLGLRRDQLPVASNTLPLRKALESEPELVAYITSHLPWLRLLVLLYGGISDNGLATSLLQYGEIASVLQLKNELWQYHIDQLRKLPYWRSIWDHDDVMMNLAVYLDTEGGELAQKAAAYVPQFTPQAIVNDSPLTPLIIQTLRQKQPPSVLKQRLWQEWQMASQDILRAYALLALLIIDTPQAIQTLSQSLNNPTTSALATRVFDLLKQRKYELADALTLLGKRAEIGHALAPLQDGHLTKEQWGDLVAIFYRTFTSVMPLPVGYDNVLLANALSFPQLNAEIWAYWLSGLDGSGEASHNYAVALDTQGLRIEAASALTHMQLAYNRKYDELTRWYILSIPPNYARYADMVGEALTIVHQSRSDVMGKFFYLGTIIFMMSDQKAQQGLNYHDYPGLKEDALAASLLVPTEFQRDLIQFLDPELTQLFAEELLHQVSERVITIKDPVIRSRALWRLSQSSYYYRQSADYLKLALQAAGQISDPLCRSCAFERLIVPLGQSEQIKNEALKAAKAIRDPNNRARALARLALYENGTKRWSLLSDALTSARKIAEESDLVETLQLIYPYLAENNQLHKVYDEIIKHLKNNWYRLKGSNVLSTVLLTFHHLLQEPQSLTPVILASLIDDIVGLKSRLRSDDLWSQLLDPVKRESTIAALLKTVSMQDLDGLFLTQQVFDVIRSLLSTHQIAALYPLLPYLRGFEPALLPSLHDWLDNPPDRVVWLHVGLLLAESGEVNLRTTSCLLELMETGIDFGRYRAGLVLHSSTVFVQKQNRDFRTSQLGEQVLMLLARTQKQIQSQKVTVATPINWIWSNIVHDDSQLLKKLVAYVEADEENVSEASNILRNISYCNNDVLNEIIHQLETGSSRIQTVLLESWFLLSRYHFKQNITAVQQMLIEDAIAEFPASALENIIVIPERTKTIATLLCSVGKRIDEKEILFQDALPELSQALRVLSLQLPTSSTAEVLKHDLYDLKYGPKQVLEAAQMVSENSTSLELLFAWLADCLRESLDDVQRSYSRVSTLLELAGATTHFSPAAVYHLCAENKLGPLLVQAVMYHLTFYGRAGAAALLGYLRETPEAFDEALLSGLHDVAEVQTVIVQMMQNLRYLDEHMIFKMLQLLEDENSSVVYAISSLLVSITRKSTISLTLRQEIMQALNRVIQRKHSSQPVFVLERAEARIYVRNVGRLDQHLYSAIVDIMGLA